MCGSGVCSKPCSSKFPNGFAEVHPEIIVRPTRAGPATELALVLVEAGNVWGGVWCVLRHS